MRRPARTYAIAMALLVSAVAVAAHATEGAAVAGAADAAHVETPLSVRTAKPLALAPESQGTRGGWKVLAAAGIIAGGLFFWKRRAGRSAAAPEATLKIVRRATVGLRSELVIVEVDGQRLLLGVTPQSIQSLAILGDAPEEHVRARVSEPPVDIGDRFAGMLGNISRGAAEPRSTPRAARLREPVSDPAEIGGQARGLLALARRR